MDITQRFLNYTQFDTQSSEESQSVPSTPKQLVFAEYLKKELEDEGLSDVEMDENGYIYATLKANTKKKTPTIGFISHYDTSPDCSGANIHPRIVKNYDGGDIVLSEGIVSSPSKFPELKAHVGEDLIVTDGHTLLGADDKAGIAEIVQAMCWLRDHDRDRFEDRKDFIEECVAKMNGKYGEGTVTADVKDQYYNMKEKIDPNMHVIDIVVKAMQECGVPPKVEPIRGGTDGAQLSFKGLPCPNIFAGGVNFHGPYEFVSIQVMEKAMQVVTKICEITAQFND